MSVSNEYFKLLDQIKDHNEREKIELNDESMEKLTAQFNGVYVLGKNYYNSNSIEIRRSLRLNLFLLADKVYQIYATETQQIDPRGWVRMFKGFRALHVAKNAGYAGMETEDPWANFRVCEQMGIVAWRGCMVRMGDKYIRITNLRKNPENEQVGESILDTLADLAAYALITYCLLEELGDHPKHSLPDTRDLRITPPDLPVFGVDVTDESEDWNICPLWKQHPKDLLYRILILPSKVFKCSGCDAEWTMKGLMKEIKVPGKFYWAA